MAIFDLFKLELSQCIFLFVCPYSTAPYFYEDVSTLIVKCTNAFIKGSFIGNRIWNEKLLRNFSSGKIRA